MSCAVAQPSGGLPDVVVSASRGESAAFDSPGSLGSLEASRLERAGPRINLSESLARLPGVAAQNRHNYAQDLQLSIRGFGARSTFGIRGVRLLVDGIPASLPDGQGQLSGINLAAVERIEVLRGPLAQIWGNAAGGVLQVFTREGSESTVGRADVSLAPEATWRSGLGVSGSPGGARLRADWSEFRTGGWRDHSEARRTQFDARLDLDLAQGTRVVWGAHHFHQPLALDPGGLTREQFRVDPRQASAASLAQNARKRVTQNQVSVTASHRVDADRHWTVRAHGGSRELFNALGVPLSAQRAPGASGGIVDLDRGFQGLALQVTQRHFPGETVLETVWGLEGQWMLDRRRGFLNEAGVPGALKRDETGKVQGRDVFAQARWYPHEAWSVLAGARSARIDFKVRDRFVVEGNPDDSGALAFEAFNPVLGLVWHLREGLNAYAQIGRGFETPTLTELAYRLEGSGLNTGLRPARSWHRELGLKWRDDPGSWWDLAFFSIDTTDEIVVVRNQGGRTVFGNAGTTGRTGVEFAGGWALAGGFALEWAWSRLDARFQTPPLVGARLPGVAPTRLFAELGWRGRALRGPHAALEWLHTGRIQVNDANTDATDSVSIWGLRAGWRESVGPWQWTALLRLDNLTQRPWVGSVIVNEASQRYFEPSPGRQAMASFSVARRFD